MTAIVACGPGGGESETDSTGDEPGSTGATTSEPTGSTGSTTSEPTGSTGSTGSTSSTGSTGEGSSSTTVEPDPDFVRECQKDDFVCDDWGCERPFVKLGECYKRCTPDVIGEKDAECDEPERPFCSQVGKAFGGDWDCNGCAHVCVAAPQNQCDQAVDECKD